MEKNWTRETKEKRRKHWKKGNGREGGREGEGERGKRGIEKEGGTEREREKMGNRDWIKRKQIKWNLACTFQHRNYLE